MAIQPIDPNTLAAIGGQKTREAAGDFASTMMQLYQVRKNAELQDLQKQQMQNELNDYQANVQVREQERQLRLQQLESETKLLPLKTQNALKNELNTSKQLNNEAFDIAGNDLADVNTAKQWRKWADTHKEILRPQFDSDEAFEEFKKNFSLDQKEGFQKNWITGKEEFLMKKYENDLAISLAKAKDSSKGTTYDQLSHQNWANLLSEQIGLDTATSKEAATIARTMTDEGIPPAAIPEVIRELLDSQFGSQGFWDFGGRTLEPGALTQAYFNAKSAQSVSQGGQGLSQEERTFGSKANPFVVENEAEALSYPPGTHIKLNGKVYVTK